MNGTNLEEAIHKSKPAGSIIDCRTDDLDRGLNVAFPPGFIQRGRWPLPGSTVACLSQNSDIFDIVQQ
jgi:hypothetical protein